MFKHNLKLEEGTKVPTRRILAGRIHDDHGEEKAKGYNIMVMVLC